MEVKMIARFVVLCCLVGVVLMKDIHEEMSSIERLQIFHTADEYEVPEYEVVAIYWPKLQTRSKTNLEEIALEAFGENIKLTLNVSDGVLAGYKTPVYLIRGGPTKLRFDKYSNMMKDIHSQMYEDLENAATLIVSHRDGKKKIVGTIGAKYLAIKPLPERFADHVIKNRKLSGRRIPEGDHDREDFHFHIIYKTPAKSLEDLQLEASLRSLNLMSLERPSIVYPEILVVVDNDYYKKLGGNVWEAIPYLLAFWNGVDMKYRSLRNPSWRLNIAAIVIAEAPGILSYIEKNTINSTKLEAAVTLGKSGDFWYQQRESIPVESYDLVATMTSKDLCSMNKEKTECEGGTLGVAYVSSACKISHLHHGISKLSLIHDEGAYDGIHTAAHELGHVFGARHDGNLDGCKTQDGFIMAAYPMLTSISSHWSPCTLKDFDKFIDSNPSCLYNKPNIDESLPRLFPGKWLDANHQCEKFGAKQACQIDSTICTNLKCYEGSMNCRTVGIAAADGTSCGDEKVCFIGKCVSPLSIV